MARSKGNNATPPGVRPERYNLTLKLDPEQKIFSGQIHILLLPEVPTNRIALDSDGLAIGECVITDSDGQEVAVKSVITDEQNGKVTLVSARQLSEQFLVSLSYTGVISESTMTCRGKAYAYCYEQPPSRCFPCINDVQFRTPFHLQLEIPDGQFALSLTKAVKTSSNEVQFEETLPIPAHVLAFAFGPIDDLLEMQAVLSTQGIFLEE
jgi:aminopeptidase N